MTTTREGTQLVAPDKYAIETVRSAGQALLVAELSANHDKDLDYALSLVDVAADCGWHCLKLQTYTAESLTMRSSHRSMTVDPVWGHTNLYDLYAEASMPMEFHEPLFERARARGLVPFTSVYDPRDLDFVEELGCELYKVASFELTYDDLLIELAHAGKPIVLSTGMASMGEVAHAIETINRHGSPEITLLHCCSSYPAPLDQINLKAMGKLRDRFGVPAGFSDHTEGAVGALTAIAMGATMIEKHFTSDQSRPGPDHRFSATPETLRLISSGADNVYRMWGDGNKTTAASEQVSKEIGRRSAFALRDLEPGTTLTRDDFRFIRPAAGIPPTDRRALEEATLSRFVAQGTPITYEDLGQ